MIAPGIAHEPTGMTSEENLFSSAATFASGVFTGINDRLNQAAGAVGDTIAGAYSWTKGEIKGAVEETEDIASGLLYKLALVGIVAIVLYFIVRKEIGK